MFETNSEGVGTRPATSGKFMNPNAARQPKLLFLAPRFPPANTSGSVRTSNIARHLAGLGWDVTVVTPHPSTWRNVESDDALTSALQHRHVRRILTGQWWRFLEPDVMRCNNHGAGYLFGGICRLILRRMGVDKGIGWIKPAEQACAALTPRDVDVIFATGKPFAAFMLARRLAKRLGRPFVLDYRDPWTDSARLNTPSYGRILKRETALLADCAAATIVSPSLAVAMNEYFKLGRRLHVITNGFDPKEFAGVKAENPGHFAIVYAGTFYPPNRVITPVMAALKRLKQKLNGGKIKEWYFHYYGPQGNHVAAESRRFGVFDRVVLHGITPRSQCLSAVKGAGLAVVITKVTDNATMEERGIITGKVFEPLGLGTPILLIAPPKSDVKTIVEDAGLGRCYSGTDIDGIATFIKESMDHPALPPTNVEAYSWPNIAKKLDGVLREAAGGHLHSHREALAL